MEYSILLPASKDDGISTRGGGGWEAALLMDIPEFLTGQRPCVSGWMYIILENPIQVIGQLGKFTYHIGILLFLQELQYSMYKMILLLFSKPCEVGMLGRQ